MRVKSLKLVNIRSYQEENIEFPEGTTLFAVSYTHLTLPTIYSV